MKITDLKQAVNIPKPTPEETSLIELSMSKECAFESAFIGDEGGSVELILENQQDEGALPSKIHIIVDNNGIRIRSSAEAGRRDPFWYRKDGKWVEAQYALGLTEEEEAKEDIIPLPDNFIRR